LYLKEENYHWCLSEMPPVLNARTPQDVFDCLRRVHEDVAYRRELIRRGREWYRRYHSNSVITDTLTRCVAQVLEDGSDHRRDTSRPTQPCE